MKTKNIFSILSLAIVMGLLLTACSQEDKVVKDIQPVKMENGFHVYPVKFDCSMSGFDDEGTTRSVSYYWNPGTAIFARFYNGSSYTLGYISFESNGTMMYSIGDLPATSGETRCELYYFEDSAGNYFALNHDTNCFDLYNNGNFVGNTTISLTASSLEMFEDVAIYAGSGVYTLGDTYWIKGTLSPQLWRMRFKGDDGTTITLPASDNDILYCSAFNWSSTETSLSPVSKDVTLTVNNGYTPYIYGDFKNADSSNKITVKNESTSYSRNFNASNLPYGKSGYFTIPTPSNYSSNGWSLSGQEMVLKDFLEKPFGFVDVNLKSDPYEIIKDKLSSMYTLYSSSDDPTHKKSLSIYVNENGTLDNMSYCGFPLYCLYVSDNYVVYHFCKDKTDVSDPYTALDQIVQDYKNAGISMSYEKKNETYTKAEGSVEVGNIIYSIELLDYNTLWQIEIQMFIKSKSNDSVLFEIPYLNWGGSVSAVKSYMSSYSLGNNAPEESDNYYLLWYKGKNKEIEIDYYFKTKTGDLTYVNVFFESSVSEDDIKAEIEKDGFTLELYEDNTYYYLSSDKKSVAKFLKNSQGYWLVQYYEYTGGGSFVLFEEPCLDWGASMSSVKSYMTDKGYTIRNEGDNYLQYNPKFKELYTYYGFESNKLDWSTVYFDKSVITVSELESEIKSTGATYWFNSESYGYVYYVTADGKNVICIGIDDSERIFLQYWEYVSGARSSSVMEKQNRIMKASPSKVGPTPRSRLESGKYVFKTYEKFTKVRK